MTGALVVLAPHPDDEILGAAGIMARARAAGERVAVIVLTDGARSDPMISPRLLSSQRVAECRAGLAALLGQVPPLLMLGRGDGTLDAREPLLRDDALLTEFLRAINPVTVLVTDPADGHPDHKAAFGLAARIIAAGLAQRLVAMPISQRIDGEVDLNDFEALPLGVYEAVKRAAIAAHHSQIASSGGFSLSQQVCDDFAATEYVRLVYDRRGDAGRPQLVAADHFDALFSACDDPWGYHSRDYEADRFERTIAALEGHRFGSALELGCANGALTQKLVAHCDSIIAVDASATALSIARKLMADTPHVTLHHGNLPEDLPSGSFDLIVLSDFLYYLGFAGCVELAGSLKSRAAPGCRIVMANYLGETECALTGEMAAEIMIAHLPGWKITHEQRCDRLRIDVLDLL